MRRGIVALSMLLAVGIILPTGLFAGSCERGVEAGTIKWEASDQAVVDGLDRGMKVLFNSVWGTDEANELCGKMRWAQLWTEVQTDASARSSFIATRIYFKYLRVSNVSDLKAKNIPVGVHRKYTVIMDEYIRLLGLYVVQGSCRITNSCQNGST